MRSWTRGWAVVCAAAMCLGTSAVVKPRTAEAVPAFEQDQRVTSLTLQSGTDAFATKNAFGGAFGSAARSNLATGISQSVADGSTSWLLEMPGLDDLTGTSSATFDLAIVNGVPRAAGGGFAYDGTSDLDWWYDQSFADADEVGTPLRHLPASFAASVLNAGPGSTRLQLNLGAPALLDMSDTRLRATSGASSRPITSTSGDPPGHLVQEGLPPTLQTFATMTGGQLAGDISAGSLASTAIPLALVSSAPTPCSQSYTSMDTMLDLLVGGCTVLTTTQVKATQPDGSVAAAGSYVFFTGASGRHITGCKLNGVTAALGDCLADATYSVSFAFTTDRVIVRRPVPGAPTGVTAQGEDGAATVSWTPPAANGGPAPTNYLVTASPGDQTCTSSGPLSCAIAGLTNGTAYAFTVTATNAYGTGPASSPSALATPADTTAPAVTITFGPAVLTPSPSVSLGFTGTDPNHPGAVLTFLCRLDSAATATACTSPLSYSSLADGTHTFRVTAMDGAGNMSAEQTRTWQVDATVPTVSTGSVRVFTLATTVGLTYSGTDTGSGIQSYDIRYRRAPWNGTFGAFIYPSASPDWQAIPARSAFLTAAKGYTYCLSARSRDRVGNLSAWSGERCTAVALDDRSLVASRGWVRGTGTGYYAGTVTRTTSKGVSLTRSGVVARRIAVVASRGPGSGTIDIYWNGALVKRINLTSTTTLNRQVLGVAVFASPRTGTLVIKTHTTRSTRIDGLAVSRR